MQKEEDKNNKHRRPHPALSSHDVSCSSHAMQADAEQNTKDGGAKVEKWL